MCCEASGFSGVLLFVLGTSATAGMLTATADGSVAAAEAMRGEQEEATDTAGEDGGEDDVEEASTGIRTVSGVLVLLHGACSCFSMVGFHASRVPRRYAQKERNRRKARVTQSLTGDDSLARQGGATPYSAGESDQESLTARRAGRLFASVAFLFLPSYASGFYPNPKVLLSHHAFALPAVLQLGRRFAARCVHNKRTPFCSSRQGRQCVSLLFGHPSSW